MKRAACTLLLTLLCLNVAAETDPALLQWANRLRSGRGLTLLDTDPLLERTAAAYAAELAQRAVLSHQDELGRRALQRVRAQGGSTVLVGEILGSGPDLRAVTSAWAASLSHGEVVCNPLWTHCGSGTARRGATGVWVLLFASHRIEALRVERLAGGYLVRGRLRAEEAADPVLLSGTTALEPLLWDSASREFSFLIPPDRGGIFHRIGYRSRTGALVVTNTFYPSSATSGPGRERR